MISMMIKSLNLEITYMVPDPELVTAYNLYNY